MNPIIDALTQSQVDLYRAHMAYVIDIGLLGITPKEAGAEGFAETYQTFGDPLTENLLHYLQPKVEETYGKKLTPTYSFWRRYHQGQDCLPHKDRPSCQVSISLNLGGEGGHDWAFYVEEQKVSLEIGQAVLYKGCEEEHWRNSLEYKNHYQIFLHYIETSGHFYPQFKYDCRPGLYYSPAPPR